MSTSSFSADLSAVAGDAGAFSQHVVAVATNAAQFNGYNAVNTVKYNLNRLQGIRLITSEEHEQLSSVADGLESRNDVSSLTESIQRRPDASPVAIALAGITAAYQSTGDPGTAALALSSAVVGTLVMFGKHTVFADDADDALSGKALACILAAVGASASCVADALVRARAGS